MNIISGIHKLKFSTNLLVGFVQIGIGFTFLFSGFSKIADPYGFYYKLLEYASVWNMDYLEPSFPILTIVLSAFEFAIGGDTLLGNHKDMTSFLVLCFMMIATPFSVYLYFANPVSDCGCFGELLKISNGVSLLKNLLLLAGAWYFFKNSKDFFSLFTPALQWFIELYLLFFALLSCWFFWSYTPLIETQPFKKGVHIWQSMQMPPNAKKDKYSTTLVYEKNGKKKKFSLENYPANDTSWHYVQTITKLLQKGYEPPISPFEIVDENGENITEKLLNHKGYSYLLIIPDMDLEDQDEVDKINILYDYCLLYRYPFHCLTASNTESIQRWVLETGSDYPICFVDKTTLRSFARNTPAVLLLENGTIKEKIPSKLLFDEEELNEPIENIIQKSKKPLSDKTKLTLWIGMLVGPLVAMFLFERIALLLAWSIRLAFRKFLKGRIEKKEESL